MTNTEKFIQLIKENPELPIVPMVDYEVVDDGYGWWVGSFGRCCVGEYALFYERYFDDREDFKEFYYDYNDDELCERFGYNPRINKFTVAQNKYTALDLEINSFNEKLLEEYLDKVADEHFTKAIIVYIGLPEEK